MVAGVDPTAKLATAGGQHPFSDRDDQAGVLRQPDELVGTGFSMLGIEPAEQRFGADDLSGADLDQRLVMQRQFAALQCVPQGDLLANAVVATLP